MQKRIWKVRRQLAVAKATAALEPPVSYSSAHSGRAFALVYRSHRSARHSPQKPRFMGWLDYLLRLVAVAVSAVCITIELPPSAQAPKIGPWSVDVCPAPSSDGARQ
jgi:hypothetical protein